ncbi:MAG: Mur ligase family protein, partial [Pseudomonadota bacterium]|nr:Mur ligase family protein [Pseudomonadota bacterium]
MKLSDLLPEETALDPRVAALDITGVTADSRTVKRGDLFVAIAGEKSDGLSFIPQAIASGAVAVMAERQPEVLADTVSFIKVANARRALALAAAKFFPRQPEVIAAVTGTSGKTSVAAFTRQIWTALGHKAASIGTIGIVSPKGETYGTLTTPDPVALHRILDRLAGEGVTHLAIEASSHGLDQHRLDGVRVAAGAFTNLSRDHLDYHPSIEAYFAAKLRLFE